MIRVAFLIALSLLAACASEPDFVPEKEPIGERPEEDEETGEAEGSEESSVQETRYCYFGPSEVRLPDGELAARNETLVQRVMRPSKNEVVELVVSYEEGATPRVFATRLKVRGESFTFTDKTQSYKGQGRFHGDDWEWESWASEARMRDGTRIRSNDRIEDGVLYVNKTIIGASGAVQVRVSEELDRIPLSECQQKLDELR